MRWISALVTFALLSATLTIAAPPATGCNPVDVRAEEDSCGTLASVSVRGDARGEDCRGVNACLTVSGTGNATNDPWSGACGRTSLLTHHSPVGCIAVSGTGDASNEAGGDSCGRGSGTGGVALGCIAVSGTGNASNEAGWQSCGVAGARLTPGAVGIGCIAVSGTGNASNSGGYQSCGLGVGPGAAGVGCLAISGDGDASNRAGWQSCGFGENVGTLAIGCIAVSGTGDAENRPGFHSCGNANDGAIAGGCEEVEGSDHVGQAPTIETLFDAALPDG